MRTVEQRASDIIKTAMTTHHIKDASELSDRTGIPAQTLRSRLANRSKWTLGDLAAISATLRLDIATMAALVGGGSCKYDHL